MLPLLLAALPLCPATGAALVVEFGAHRLTLCRDGVAQRDYKVAVGAGGGTRGRVRWTQTPLGVFELLAPRPSAQFHTFIPLRNPDPKRFSAWAIGLHGPPRETKDEGGTNVATDWTWGCVALASDSLVDEVAAFVRAHRVTRVEFRE